MVKQSSTIEQNAARGGNCQAVFGRALRLAAALLLFLLLPVWLGYHVSGALAWSPPGLSQPASPADTNESGQPLAPPPFAGDWLSYVNYYRAQAGLPAVEEEPVWSDGHSKHARYMVKNGVISHYEDAGNPWYTGEGMTAGQSGNIFAMFGVSATDRDAIDFWMEAPFHALGILDPSLQAIGYGSYSEAINGLRMGASLDIVRGRKAVSPFVTFPIRFPEDGTIVPISSYPGGEMPNPLSSCPGYAAPAGLPVILQLGAGDRTPSVLASSITEEDEPLEHCVFDQTSYTNPDPSLQSLGRSILRLRNAVVLVPRSPLKSGATYSVSITSGDQTYSWSFSVDTGTQSTDFTD